MTLGVLVPPVVTPLQEEEEDYRDLELGMRDPPPITEDWEARAGWLVTVSHLGSWRRALCLQSSGPVSRVYLVDEGYSVGVSQDDLRPMSPSLRCIPALAYQVKLRLKFLNISLIISRSVWLESVITGRVTRRGSTS